MAFHSIDLEDTALDGVEEHSLGSREAENKPEIGRPNRNNDASVAASPVNVTMARPHLRWLNDDAVIVSYTRLTQRVVDGEYITASCCETRIWQRLAGSWKQVHVHRS